MEDMGTDYRSGLVCVGQDLHYVCLAGGNRKTAELDNRITSPVSPFCNRIGDE